ncbi:MAG TPA: hypothetical protein VGN20_14040 [Mucilaginibacter sp.]
MLDEITFGENGQIDYSTILSASRQQSSHPIKNNFMKKQTVIVSRASSGIGKESINISGAGSALLPISFFL